MAQGHAAAIAGLPAPRRVRICFTECLQEAPRSRLRIDKSFIGDLTSGSCDARLVEAILNMAATFRLKVTAEGVEAVDQENWLAAAGCERGQGFLHGAPMSGERILRLATEHRSCRLPDGCVALA